MKTILDTIIDQKRKEVIELRKAFSISDFENMEYFNTPKRSLKNALVDSGFGIIAEYKRKSPSAGLITDKSPVEQSIYYQHSGVAAISCLTDKHFFGGSNEDFLAIRKNTTIPLLRKEFIVDEFQIFESKAIGADAILLISEVLRKEELLHFTIMAQSLGLEVLIEAHDKKNLAKINDDADIIGINNRDLHLQETNITTSFELYNFIPESAICISESGISSPSELVDLYQTGYSGALIGEQLLKNKKVDEFVNATSKLFQL